MSQSEWMVRFVHKISPSPKDVMGPVSIPDSAFADSKTLGAALRRAGVLEAGARVRHFRTEGDKVVVFPTMPGSTTYWHSIILTHAGEVEGRATESRMSMPRGVHKDAEHLHDILDKGVMLAEDRVDGSVDLNDPSPVYVGIIVDVSGYGPHVGAMYVFQNRYHGHPDTALQEAHQILEEWTIEHYPEHIEELEKEWGDEWSSILTETFDGWAFELSPQDFVNAIQGTDAEKFIDVEPLEEDEGDLDEARRRRRRPRRGARVAESAGVEPTAKNILEWLGPYMEHEGLDAPRESARLARLIDNVRTRRQAEEVLEEVNRVIRGHGVEAIRIEGAYIDNYHFDIVATYVNVGDSYAATLLHESETGNFVLTTWGDWVEAHEQEYLPEEEEDEEESDWDSDEDD
jgi:hypothetical protein